MENTKKKLSANFQSKSEASLLTLWFHFALEGELNKKLLNHVKKKCIIGTLHFEGELITDLNRFLRIRSLVGHVQRLYCSLPHVRFCRGEGDAELQHVVQY